MSDERIIDPRADWTHEAPREEEEWELHVFDDHDNPDTPSPFRVDDLRKADWAVRKIAEIQSDYAAITAQYDQQMAAWKTWRDHEHERLEQQRAYFVGLLQAYFTQYRETHPRVKTLKVPHGALKLRKSPPQVLVTQEPIFLAWAKVEAPDLVRVKEEPNQSAIRQAAVKDGLAIPGVRVIEVPDRFEVDTKGVEA